VQAKRSNAISSRRERGNSQHRSLLTGMIRDHADRPMSPSHATKNRRRYRYYVSSMASVIDDRIVKFPTLRLPAAELEQAVTHGVATRLMDQRTIMALPMADAATLNHRLRAVQSLAFRLGEMGKSEMRQMLMSLGLVIIVHPDRIDASTSQRKLIAQLGGQAPATTDDGARIAITIPTSPDRRGRNLKLVLRSGIDRPPLIDADLVALLRKAELARRKLFTHADSTGTRDREVERITRLAFLTPDIVDAILEGRQPSSLTARVLLKQAGIPLDWKSQRKALGF
jgi:hypothetical protein